MKQGTGYEMWDKGRANIHMYQRPESTNSSTERSPFSAIQNSGLHIQLVQPNSHTQARENISFQLLANLNRRIKCRLNGPFNNMLYTR